VVEGECGLVEQAAKGREVTVVGGEGVPGDQVGDLGVSGRRSN
jgi:hypothetical protein